MANPLECGFDGKPCEDRCALFQQFCPRAGGRTPLTDAVTAERERCAKIADDYAKRAWKQPYPCQEAAVAAEHIAINIRASGQ
jgi:hypothetical protein